jgi:hypothetical protein
MINYHEDLDGVDQIFADRFPLTKVKESFTVQVGQLGMNVSSNIEIQNILDQRYQGFLGSKEKLFNIETDRIDLDLKHYRNILVQSRKSKNIHYIFRWDFVAKVDINNRISQLLMTEVGSPLCVDSILRIATSFLAIEKNGLLVHSGAIQSKGNNAYIFAGVSGSGKSTIAKISNDSREVITDEMTLVEKRNDSYYVSGTPFWGEMQVSKNISRPLNAIFILQQAKEHRIEEIPKTLAISDFMRTVMYFAQNQDAFSQVLEHVVNFLEKVPIYRLHFKPELALWELIDDQFEG